MAFSLSVLFEAFVLFINSVAILSEERFLKPIGWVPAGKGLGDEESVKERIITFLTAVRMLMRIPLIFLNLLVIVFELLFG